MEADATQGGVKATEAASGRSTLETQPSPTRFQHGGGVADSWGKEDDRIPFYSEDDNKGFRRHGRTRAQGTPEGMGQDMGRPLWAPTHQSAHPGEEPHPQVLALLVKSA